MVPVGYVFGDTLTWADNFLYPLLADLEATPESYTINVRLKAWLAEMKKLPEVEKTLAGTLAVGGRPPAD
jgi:glutathione S-transferase